MMKEMMGVFLIMFGGFTLGSGLIIGALLPAIIPQSVPNWIWMTLVGAKTAFEVVMGASLLDEAIRKAKDSQEVMYDSDNGW